MRVTGANELRTSVGLPPIERTTDAWDRFPALVTTIAELDTAVAPKDARYVGPVVERHAGAAWDPPWAAEDSRPLVLVTFSTARFWDQRGRIERTLAALEGEPVRVLVCAPDVADVALPSNAVLRRFVPHALVMPSASVVVTHCGHGTVAAALEHGVPIVGLPNKAADQPFLAERAQALGAGVALDGEADPSAIRAAVRQVLSTPEYAAAARRLGASIASAPKAEGAATELERLVAGARN
jgi:UDP:flavonoid glycosyltransferase YjiC (YdhE family)